MSRLGVTAEHDQWEPPWLFTAHGNWINKANTDFYPCWFWQDWSKFSTVLKGYRYLFLERTQHYSSSVYQEFNLDVEETQTCGLGIWLMNMIKLDPQIMMSRNCQFSSIGFDRLCQLSQSSFCQIKLSIILWWAAKLGKNTLLSLWRWPTVRLTHNGKMVTDSVRRAPELPVFCFVMKGDNFNWAWRDGGAQASC